jgi:hypothetical protein
MNNYFSNFYDVFIFSANPIIGIFMNLFLIVVQASVILMVINVFWLMVYTLFKYNPKPETVETLATLWVTKIVSLIILVLFIPIFFIMVGSSDIIADVINDPSLKTTMINDAKLHDDFKSQLDVLGSGSDYSFSNDIKSSFYGLMGSEVTNDQNFVNKSIDYVFKALSFIALNLLKICRTIILTVIFVTFPYQTAKALAPWAGPDEALLKNLSRVWRVASWSVWAAIVNAIFETFLAINFFNRAFGVFDGMLGDAFGIGINLIVNIAYIIVISMVPVFARKFDTEKFAGAMLSSTMNAGKMIMMNQVKSIITKTAGRGFKAGKDLLGPNNNDSNDKSASISA